MSEESDEQLESSREVPWTALSAGALRGVIEEFVSREGTDYGNTVYNIDQKVGHVQKQLEKGEAKIFYDHDTQTVNIVRSDAIGKV
jgi:uncharacterized protein YheU (UPF0270 family)